MDTVQTNEAPAVDTYDKFLADLNTAWNEFMAEAKDGKTNKAAALRARKLSLKFRANLQDFRVVSIANDKKSVEAK
jgi:hypothetical protein